MSISYSPDLDSVKSNSKEKAIQIRLLTLTSLILIFSTPSWADSSASTPGVDKTAVGSSMPNDQQPANVTLVAQATSQTGDSTTESQPAAEEAKNEIEEVTVTGSQIRGAAINDALAVSVISAEDIEAMGISSGDELLDTIPEQGQNLFSEAENISGGVNSARGDIGAVNLRNLGTGNTLVLLNGRRVVNSATFQTEEVGGSFVPVNTANSAAIPVNGIERLEILRDGASAIYGADAVAGVINTVIKKGFDGFTIRGRWAEYDHLPRNDQTLTIEWGTFFNGGATNIGVFANRYERDRVNSQDDEKWADADFRRLITDENSPFFGNTSFRNTSANSRYGQFDLVASQSGDPYGLRAAGIVDGSGEFETYPIGDARCEGGYVISSSVCGHVDGQGTFRHNLNENRDLASKLERTNIFVYLNHEFSNGAEAYTELSWYKSDTNLNRHASSSFSSVKLRVDKANYYNPLGPCGSPNRLPDEVIGTLVPCEGLDMTIDNFRFAEFPRIIDNKGETYRFLQGFRGTFGTDWDWDSAVVYSKSKKSDVTHNRVSNNLMVEALSDPTAAAYNPFNGGVNNNIERTLIDVRRDSEATLKMVDFKLSNAEVFNLWSMPVAFLAGIEYRDESFKDDRDPRLDGTIVFTDFEGDTYPFVSDVVNSSPTPDNSGSRNVTSVFFEFAVPLHDTLDVQLAMRYEDFSDVGNTTVPKVAFGWAPTDWFLLRGSWSEAFRAPNLITINETIVVRNNTRDDWACTYAADFGGDPDQDTLDCRNTIQRRASGSTDLKPEQSTNTSIGVVLQPTEFLTLTLDFWKIDKEDTIGLFGEENHTLLDLLARLEAGTGNCASFQGNPAVVRDAPGEDEAAIYLAAGICPGGDINFIADQYANLDARVVEGMDFGVYLDFENGAGDWSITWVGSYYSKYDQEPAGLSQLLLEAQDAGVLPSNYPVTGFDDLIGRSGNQDLKMNARLRWRRNNWGASASAFYLSNFFQESLTLSDGTQWTIPSHTTFSATVDYSFDLWRSDTRVRFGVKNITNERAPLADRFFGFFADAHRDYGRNFYLDLRLAF